MKKNFKPSRILKIERERKTLYIVVKGVKKEGDMAIITGGYDETYELKGNDWEALEKGETINWSENDKFSLIFI